MCPKCGGKSDSFAIVHNKKDNETYRKRRCSECGHVFFTVEFDVKPTKRLLRDWFLNSKSRKRR